MQRRPHRLVAHLTALVASAFVLSVTTIADAKQPKDDAALDLYDQAMEEDYFNVQFDKAIGRLENAVKLCGKDKCSPKVLAKVHVAAATIWFAKANKEQAKESFIKALEVDPGAKPLEDYTTEPLEKIFKEAQKEVGSGPKPPPKPKPSGDDDDDDDDDDDGKPIKAPAGDLDYDPPEEGLVSTPLPIFVRIDTEVGGQSAKLRFKPFGGTKWLSVKMRRMGDGFGGVIPCNELTTTGKVRFYIIIKDAEGDPVATVGSLKSPYSVKIVNQLEGEQPSLPGEKPPEKCIRGTEECPPDAPPDFPGCQKAKPLPAGECERGDKGWGASCETTCECRQGYVCLNGSCEQGTEEPSTGNGETGTSVFEFHHMISLNFQLDLLAIGGATNVCGYENNEGKFQQDLDNYFCFRADDDDGGEYLGRPEEDKFNEIEGGLGLASGRILLGYDFAFWKGLSVGIRIGYAFGGSPSIGDDIEARFKACVDATGGDQNPGRDGYQGPCREPVANDFMPFHLEFPRIQYFFLPDAFKQQIRPYAFAGFGIVGQVNAGVPVAVCDNVDKTGVPLTDPGGTNPPESPSTRCPTNTDKRDNIEAYQVTGLNFVSFGVGGTFAITDLIGVNAELKMLVMLPTVGFVFAPSVAPVVMF